MAETLFTGFYPSDGQYTNGSWNKLSLSLTYRLPETVATFVNEVMYGGVHQSHQSQSQQAQLLAPNKKGGKPVKYLIGN